MTERRLMARFLTKDAVLGWVALSIIIAMAIIGFQFIRDRNSGNDILASEPAMTTHEISVFMTLIFSAPR